SDLFFGAPMLQGRALGLADNKNRARLQRWSYVGSPEGTTNHEFGHVIDNYARDVNHIRPGSNAHGNGEAQRKLPRNWREIMKQSGSEYGSTSPNGHINHETFAELYSLYRATGKIPPSMEPFFFAVFASIVGKAGGVSKKKLKKLIKADQQRANVYVEGPGFAYTLPTGQTIFVDPVEHRELTVAELTKMGEEHWAAIQRKADVDPNGGIGEV